MYNKLVSKDANKKEEKPGQAKMTKGKEDDGEYKPELLASANTKYQNKLKNKKVDVDIEEITVELGGKNAINQSELSENQDPDVPPERDGFSPK